MLEKGSARHTCKHCGAVNEVQYTDYPERDKGKVNCAKCGEELFSWKGTRDWHTATLVTED